MSQKKAKLINKFIKVTGKEKSGLGWTSNFGTTKHVLLESKRIKRAYSEANSKRKTGLSIVMLTVVKKSNGKTN